MRFGLVHRLMTDALAALGVLALIVSGQFSRALDAALVLALAGAIALKEPWRQKAAEKHVDAVATSLLIVVQLARGALTVTSVLDLLIEFAVGLQVIRVATRNGAAHDQQVIVLALLHLIAGTVVGGGLGYGVCFIGLLVVTPGALVLSHLRREVEGNYRQGARDRTGLPVDVPRILRSKRVVGKPFVAVTCLLSLPILVFTAILFVVFPRVGLSLLLLNAPRGERMVGFSGTVNLGQIGTLRSDPTIALRVALPDLPAPPPARRLLHLRGTALDHYDGRTWTQSSKALRPIGTSGELVPISGAPTSGERPWRIELEPFDPPVRFIPPNTKAIELVRSGTITPGGALQLQAGPEGEYRYQGTSDRVVRYELYPSELGAPSFTRLRASDRPRYLQLPDGLSPRVAQLAAEWTRDAGSVLERVRLVEEHLRTDFRYDLASPSGKAEHPLEDFLFESRRGHCEYFSTAMAVMLRTLDVPTRNVTGFVGGTYNKYGNFYAVRQGDAHSWVEAYLEGKGWLTFDPTPPGAAEPQSDVDGALAALRDFFEATSQRWNQHVLGYDLSQQATLFETLHLRDGSPFGPSRSARTRTLVVVVGLALVGGGWWWRRRRRRRKEGDSEDAEASARDAQIAAKMYALLDAAMASAGIRRLESTPPLRHALALVDRGHPLSSEVAALTERYLAARFGDAPLSEDERRDFELRTRWLSRAPHALGQPPVQPELEEEATGRESGATEGGAPVRSSRRPPPIEAAPVAAVETDDLGRMAVVADDDLAESTAAPPVVATDLDSKPRRPSQESPSTGPATPVDERDTDP